MEAKTIEFKSALKMNLKPNTKQETLKNKDFNSTLESINNSKNNYKEDSQMPKKVNSQVSTDTNDDKSKINNNKNISLEDDEKISDKKESQINYEGMMFLFNNKVETISSNIISEEKLLGVELVVDKEDIGSKMYSIDNLEISEEISIVENNSSNETMNNLLSKESNIEESDIKESNIKEFNIKESNVKESNIVLESYEPLNNKFDPKFDSNLMIHKMDKEVEEEISIKSTNDFINLNQISKDRNFNNLDSMDNSEESNQNQEELIIKSVINEDDLEIHDKPFVFLEKGLTNIESTLEINKPETIDQKDLIQQIVQRVKIDLSESKNEMRIKLKPEVLGEMTMNIEVVKGEIVAKIMVDNQRTKEIIETNLIQLKEGIKGTALEIKTFEVFVGSGSDFDKHNANHFNSKQNNRKIKIKADNSKKVLNYEERLLESKTNSVGLYSKDGLNLFA